MAPTMDQAADGVWLVTGTDNNWVLVADGNEVTLVDAGFPGDLPQVLASLQRIGRVPGDIRAIVLTHAHPDHLGGSERLRADHGIPVRMLDAEAPHGHRAGHGAADHQGRVAAASAAVVDANPARRRGEGRTTN